MRILFLTEESYPTQNAVSFIQFHQSMALEELGHEVHLYNCTKPPLNLMDYLQAYEFDLILLELSQSLRDTLWRALHQFRRTEAVRLIGTMNRLSHPPPAAWDLIDFTVTPWHGETVDALRRTRDIRYLPLGYNASLHRRETDLQQLGPVFVGNTLGDRAHEAEEYLGVLRLEQVVLCIGPGFEQKYLDPFMLGRVYAASRCVPNLHYSREKGKDCILNERFWQAGRCGIPVNDHSPLMDQVWDRVLVKEFCFADKPEWQDRVRQLNSGARVDSGLITRLDESFAGHSYRNRMLGLLQWLE
jgi:hypothetical protein